MAHNDWPLKMRAILLKRLDEIENSSAAQSTNNVQVNDGAKGDAADVAFGAIEDEIASKLIEHGSHEIEQIIHAIERIDNGSYGICENCQHKISLARLRALPCCTMCIDCQRSNDSSNS